MTTHAYAEFYIDDSMNNLGEAFDYAINDCGLDIDEFMTLFISTGYAAEFGNGNPGVISGLSGVELVMKVLDKANKSIVFPKSKEEYDRSPGYWAGWVLAYYQWETARSFKDIHSSLNERNRQNVLPAS